MDNQVEKIIELIHEFKGTLEKPEKFWSKKILFIKERRK